ALLRSQGSELAAILRKHKIDLAAIDCERPLPAAVALVSRRRSVPEFVRRILMVSEITKVVHVPTDFYFEIRRSAVYGNPTYSAEWFPSVTGPVKGGGPGSGPWSSIVQRFEEW